MAQTPGPAFTGGIAVDVETDETVVGETMVGVTVVGETVDRLAIDTIAGKSPQPVFLKSSEKCS